MKINKPFYHDAELYFDTLKKGLPIHETVEKYHRRLEICTYYLVKERAWECEWEKWANLNEIGMVKTHVCANDTVRENLRYFITSLTNVKKFANAVRKHWSIENRLHWNLDMILREDAARARKENSPLNMNVLRISYLQRRILPADSRRNLTKAEPP